MRHIPRVLAHSTDALIIFDLPTGDRRNFSELSRSGVPKSSGRLMGFRLGLWIVAMAWVWSWIPTASGGGVCRIARAEAGLRAPLRRRFSSTSSRLFTGSAPERDNDRRLSNVPEFPESCRFEIRDFARSSAPFSFRMNARVSSFFQMKPNAYGAHQT